MTNPPRGEEPGDQPLIDPLRTLAIIMVCVAPLIVLGIALYNLRKLILAP